MKNTILKITAAFLFTTSILLSQKTNVKNQPEELGQVSWYRNYDEAIAQSKKMNKPLFILFQEVPGCTTCRNYGKNVLSHPLIVDAIENEFIPLAIYNNVKGCDREILNRYKEPTWNNPVVRIVKSNGKDIIKRLSGNYSSLGLVNHMLVALSSGFYGQPKYLELAALELETAESSQYSKSTYSMYCFWTGEAHLGQLDGVVATEPGFMNGKEVVRVTYNQEILDQKTVTAHAQKANCSLEKNKSKFKADKDPQYYLKQTPLKYLALTPIQKTKINSALKNKDDASVYLSPSQVQYLNSITAFNSKKSKSLYDMEFIAAWKLMKKISRKT